MGSGTEETSPFVKNSGYASKSGQNPPVPKDVDRVKVYRAEQQVASALSTSSGNFDFFGSKLYVQPETTFEAIEQIQCYVETVLSNYSKRTDRQIVGVKVRQRKGNQEAHYEFDTKTIAIPTTANWAMRELVILHEVAHHITWQTSSRVAAHGAEFLQTYLELVAAELSAETNLLLRAAFDAQGLRIEIPR
jgi:putative metallohydrolase (TIGR04338 family)